jgi:type II secretory pathway pseudopilin PulG
MGGCYDAACGRDKVTQRVMRPDGPLGLARGSEAKVHDVFISYSSMDKAVADAVCAELENNEVRCWIAPRDIRPGAEWGESIVEAINNCRVMVLVFSRSANESPQIRREVERAVNKGVIVVPLRIEDVVPTRSLEYFIGAVHWLDALTPPIEHHVKTLAADIRRILGDKRLRDTVTVPRESDEPAPVIPARQNVDFRQARTPAHGGEEAARTDGKSIGSFICGLLFFLFPAALAAIVLGHLSRADIRRSGGKLKGGKLALAGLILGYAGLVALPLLLLLAIAIPNLLNTRVAADEASATASLRELNAAVITYQSSYGKFPPDLRSLGPQAPGRSANDAAANLIGAELAEGVRSGYKFAYQVNSDSSNFKIEATPLVPGKTGLRYMWIDKSGDVQFSYTPASP